MEKQENVIFLIQMDESRKWDPIRVDAPAVLGRSDSADVKIDQDSVSGNHAKIVYDQGKFVISDLESTNGTRINGQRIKEETIREGDLLSLGLVNFLVKVCDSLPRLFCPEEGRIVAIGMLPFIIGRMQGSHLIVQETSVSGRHCTIYDQNRQYVLKDNKSTNGTRVNGRRVNYTSLNDGDVIKIGKWQAIFLEKEMTPEGYRLMFLSGQRAGQTMEVQEHLKIGRTSENNLVIEETPVSGNHALIYWDHRRFWLKDLASRNGTRVGGVRIREVPLKHGDEILIANQSLLFYNTQLPREKFYLVFLEGARGGESVELDKPKISIGRNANCPICIPQKEVSGRHAEIEAKDGSFTLKDLGSTNGTLLNGVKVKTAVLKHGDEIQVGMQRLIFRNSAKASPEVLKEENFVLLPVYGKKYGSPVKLGESLSIGSAKDNDLVLPDAKLSPKHAIISRANQAYSICDCGSHWGTRVNGEKIDEISLEHGDEVVIGKHRFIFKSTLKPLRTEPVLQVPYWFSAAAVAMVLFLFVALAVLSTRGGGPDEFDGGNKTVDLKKYEREDKEWMTECENKVQEHTRRYQYDKAIQSISEYKAKMALLVYREILDKRAAEIRREQAFFNDMVSHVKGCKADIHLPIPGHGECKVENKKISAESISLSSPTSPDLRIGWEEISLAHFFELVDQSLFYAEKPFQSAQMAYQMGYRDPVEKYLICALEKKEVPPQEVFAFLATAVLGIKVPDRGFVVHQGRLVTHEKKEELEKLEQERLERLKEQEEREKEERERIALEKYRKENETRLKERELEEFQLRYTVIDEFVRTYSYRKAIEKFRAFQEELNDPQLKSKVEQRIRQIDPMADLMDQLVKAINKKDLADNKVQFSEELSGTIESATREEFRIVIPQGSMKNKWYYLHPRQMHTFFSRMKLNPKYLYILGIFCFENELLDEGNETFVRLLREYPKAKKMVDQYLAAKLGVPIPEGGFVPYQGRLVSHDEREKRQKGYLKYRGEWVTPEEKEKLEAGFIKHKGEWVTQDEKKLIARGYRKYKGKYYTPDELAQLRSQWEEAWECSTTNYDIRCNMSEQFVNELAIFMEAAYKEYEKFFGRPARKRMIIYGFRSYEDYRNYCLKTGNEASLRAGGFATSHNSTGVGWSRGDAKSLLTTLMHEGAHLFHYSSCPKAHSLSWFYESVATQFEGYEWDGKKMHMHFISPMRLPWLQRRLQQNKYIPIADMLKGNALEFINRDPEEAATFYSQCWGIYYYLWRSENEKHRARFRSFVQKMNDGEYAGREQNAFLDEFAGEVENVETSWKKYMLGLRN